MDPSRRALVAGLIVIAVIAVFLAGLVPGWLRTRRVFVEYTQCQESLRQTEANLAQAQLDLQIARLRGDLGEVMQEANANNFGVAAERATRFFDGVRAVAASDQLSQALERRKVLEAVLARRDAISADFALADPAVKSKLAEMYMHLGEAVE
jgi:type II secretory pathway pseudopilin PulG